MSKLPPDVANYAAALKALAEKWTPHPGQLAPGRALFTENVKRIFLRFGRQSGKSQFLCYSCVRWALTNPGARVAIITPFLKQSRQIFLHSRLVETMIPAEFLQDIHQTDGRFTLKNGSVIELYGADNSEALRGLTFDLVVVDEIKDVPLKFIDSVVMATLLVKRAPLILSGTPPEIAEHPYWALVKQAQEDPSWRHFHLTSFDNPYVPRDDLEAEKARYAERGELDTFQREFLAEFVPGSKRAIFGMLSETEHVRPYHELFAQIARRPESWTYYVALDPGTASVFAAVVVAINHYRSHVLVMDEVYATNQRETSIGQFWPKVQKAMDDVWKPEGDDEPWVVVVDEAATWARNEMMDQFQVPSWPTNKAQNKKMDGISLIKDLLNRRHLLISDRCKDLLREMRGYMTNAQGLPIKANDHAIDGLRYALGISHLSVQTSSEPLPPAALTPGQRDDPPRAFTIEQDMAAHTGPSIEPYLLDLEDDYLSFDDGAYD
jgi:PBSX family phage terminase large subunit